MKYVLYFIIGGTVVSISTWAGSLGRSWLAAFVSTLPTLTVLTFILISRISVKRVCPIIFIKDLPHPILGKPGFT